MEIDVVENPVRRLSEAINCHLAITAPEQSEAAQQMSPELLLTIVQTVPDCVAAVECDGAVNSAALDMLRAETMAGGRDGWWPHPPPAPPPAIYPTPAPRPNPLFQQDGGEFFPRAPPQSHAA